MRENNHILFVMGYRNLAYQLEALTDKAPHIEDDLENLSTMIISELKEAESRSETNFERGRELGHDEGYQEGYEESQH
ncbi:hypothetical protein CON09_08460 [Bacillus anthracis]|nr:hypothetical protein CON09_08460 [Bacillus anthracis]